jgi:hypothetical protein
VTLIGVRRDAYRVLVGRSEGKRPLGKTWRRWEDNMKTDFQDTLPTICVVPVGYLLVISELNFCEFNPLKTKGNLFYTRTQCVPRCKHSPLRL